MGDVIRVNFKSVANGVLRYSEAERNVELREHIRDILQDRDCLSENEDVDDVVNATDGVNLLFLNAAKERMRGE